MWLKNSPDSAAQIRRYIRLTELLPEVQKKVDSKEIAFSPAVELSYLTHDEQKQFLDAMDYSQNTPSLSQAQRLKKLSREGKCTKEAMRSIMSEEKKEEQERITLSSDTLRKYFPEATRPCKCSKPSSSCWSSGRKTAAPERALRKAGLSMNVTINIYGDVHIHCDCCDERGVYADDLEESPKPHMKMHPIRRMTAKEIELSIAEKRKLWSRQWRAALSLSSS